MLILSFSQNVGLSDPFKDWEKFPWEVGPWKMTHFMIYIDLQMITYSTQMAHAKKLVGNQISHLLTSEPTALSI